jgi:hypothetical protein
MVHPSYSRNSEKSFSTPPRWTPLPKATKPPESAPVDIQTVSECFGRSGDSHPEKESLPPRTRITTRRNKTQYRFESYDIAELSAAVHEVPHRCRSIANANQRKLRRNARATVKTFPQHCQFSCAKSKTGIVNLWRGP